MAAEGAESEATAERTVSAPRLVLRWTNKPIHQSVLLFQEVSPKTRLEKGPKQNIKQT